MCISYNHFSIVERGKIDVLREQGWSIRAIARILQRAPSSVSRELRRNPGNYCPHAAQSGYMKRRENCRKHRILDNPEVCAIVEDRLRRLWSPEEICGRWALCQGRSPVSYATIYRSIHNGKLPLQKLLRRKGRNYSKHEDETRGRIHGYKSIHERPAAANDRSEYGHWEGDTLQGKKHSGCLAIFVDRKSKFLIACLLHNRKAATMNAAMIEAFRDLPPPLRRTFTFDHGNEFFGYREIEDALQSSVFFADPYCSWQRGLNENTNGLLRQYFPKRFDFTTLSPEELASVVRQLNDRPRKSLGYRTSAECFPFSFRCT